MFSFNVIKPKGMLEPCMTDTFTVSHERVKYFVCVKFKVKTVYKNTANLYIYCTFTKYIMQEKREK